MGGHADCGRHRFETDASKAKSREWMRQRLLERFPDEKIRRELSVAFLAGPSLVEADQIYLRAGIAPSNIWGIERDAEAFKAAKAQNDSRAEGERINIVHADAGSFFDGSRRFGVISLDFLQNYGPDIIRVLDAIFRPYRDSISGETHLFLNAQARREHSKYLWRLAVFNMMSYSLAMTDIGLSQAYLDSGEGYDHNLYSRLRTGLIWAVDNFLGARRSAESSMGVLKSADLTGWTRSGIFEEVFIRAHYGPLRTVPASKIWEASGALMDKKEYDIRRLIDVAFCQNAGHLMLDSDSDSLLDTMRFAANGQANLEGLYASFFTRLAAEEGLALSDESWTNHIALGYMLARFLGISVLAHETFDYVSESGTPMLLNSFSLSSNPRRLFSKGTEELRHNFFSRDTAMGVWLRICGSGEREFVKFKRAALRHYKNSFTALSVIRDFRKWHVYQPARELLNSFKSGSLEDMICVETNLTALIWQYMRVRLQKQLALQDQINEIQKLLAPPGREGRVPVIKIMAQRRFPDFPPSSAFSLTRSDIEAILALAAEGHGAREIFESFFRGSAISPAEIVAVADWAGALPPEIIARLKA